MKQHIISTTHPVDDEGRPLVAEEQPKARERIELPPITVEPCDPWADCHDPRHLTQDGRDALPAYARAPHLWFQLTPAARAHIGGLVTVLLREQPPAPGEHDNQKYQRLAEVLRRVELALMGAVRPRENLEANGHDAMTVAYAARVWSDDSAERAAWQRHRDELTQAGNHQGRALLRECVRGLDDSRGAISRERARRQQADKVLANLERLFGPEA